MSQNIAFSGEVREAKCPCHKGQFGVFVFMHSEQGEINFLTVFWFETEELAEKNCEISVFTTARDALAKAGIRDDQIGEVKASYEMPEGFAPPAWTQAAGTVH